MVSKGALEQFQRSAIGEPKSCRVQEVLRRDSGEISEVCQLGARGIQEGSQRAARNVPMRDERTQQGCLRDTRSMPGGTREVLEWCHRGAKNFQRDDS